jgi:hypothetical protein
MRDYSQRCSTFERDRLAALAGIIAIFEWKTGRRHMLGLITDHLWFHLAWRTGSHRASKGETFHRIPSWSPLRTHGDAIPPSFRQSRAGTFSTALRHEDSHVKWKDDPYVSQLEEANLVVKGNVAEAVLKEPAHM